MRGRLQQGELIGLLLIGVGMSLVVCLLRGRGAWPRAVPGVLTGLSMISFGWSSLVRCRRQR